MQIYSPSPKRLDNIPLLSQSRRTMHPLVSMITFTGVSVVTSCYVPIKVFPNMWTLIDIKFGLPFSIYMYIILVIFFSLFLYNLNFKGTFPCYINIWTEQQTRSFKEDLHVHTSVSLTGQEPLQSCHNVNMPNHCVASYGSNFPHSVVLGDGQVVTHSGFPDVRQCTLHFLSPMMTLLYPRCPQSTKWPYICHDKSKRARSVQMNDLHLFCTYS